MNSMQKELERRTEAAEAAAGAERENDPYRQGFHLMPPSGWMNDPNGLCWYRGRYHVFYQYSPLDANRGQIFWGHWSSPDMLEWTQHPVFLHPVDEWDSHGVYSGSALAEDDGLYLYYTGNVKHPGDYDYIYKGRGHNVGLAVTEDGVSADSNRCILENKDYPSDLSCHVRDPKVWKQDGRYYMVLGARTMDDVGEILVFESDDRESWKHINTIKTPEKFGYMWECPDMFCVDGQWVVMTSPQGIEKKGYSYQNVYSCGYLPLNGDFRGEYTLGEYHETDAGFDYYAPQTFETPDGRRIVIGWMGMPDADYTNPTANATGWQHCMSAPRELHWNGSQITAYPISELESLRENRQSLAFKGELITRSGRTADIIIKNDDTELTLDICGSAGVEWDDGLLCLSLSEQAGSGRTKRFWQTKELSELRILMDNSSIELFINGGKQTMSTRFYPQDEEGSRTLKISGTGTMELYDLHPMTFHWTH